MTKREIVQMVLTRAGSGHFVYFQDEAGNLRHPSHSYEELMGFLEWKWDEERGGWRELGEVWPLTATI